MLAPARDQRHDPRAKCSVALPVRTDALGYVHDGLAIPVRFVVFPAAGPGRAPDRWPGAKAVPG
jgi:hypothetical protein